MKSYKEVKKELLKDPEVKREYDALEAEYEIIDAIVKARAENNLTQKQLSERTGITQADISRIERGNSNPTIGLLRRLADGMNMQLKLTLIPKSHLHPKRYK